MTGANSTAGYGERPALDVMSDKKPTEASPTRDPPTIGYLHAQGVTRFRVSCNEINCGHDADLTHDTLGLSDNTSFHRCELATVEVLELRIAEGQLYAAVAVSLRTSPKKQPEGRPKRRSTLWLRGRSARPT